MLKRNCGNHVSFLVESHIGDGSQRPASLYNPIPEERWTLSQDLGSDVICCTFSCMGRIVSSFPFLELNIRATGRLRGKFSLVFPFSLCISHRS